MMRNSTIDIAKGVAIILMVVGHAGCPEGLYKFIYSFHMPLFFILSGYFLNQQNLSDTKIFAIRKWKKLALPLLIAGIVSLLLHNFFFHWGIINDSFGTSTGDVAHLFSIKDTLQRTGLLIGLLEVYDDPFLGPTWFIQCMFWAYILIASIHYICKKYSWRQQQCIGLATMIIGSIILTFLHMFIPTLKTIFVTRVFIGGTFIYIGSLGHSLINKWDAKWWQLCLAFVILCSSILSPISISMEEYIIPYQFVMLLITGCIGTLFIYGISQKVVCWNKNKEYVLTSIGQSSFYILFLHMLMFKPISYLFIQIYDLEPTMIGCRPTIYSIANSWHWIMYSVGSILLCMIIAYISKKIQTHEKTC